MAIIKPSLKFEGSELNIGVISAPYIKDNVRKAVFNKSTNQEGAYLYFLPAYKVDDNGNGVWYKRVIVRDNFGTNMKEKYYVADRATDPAEYFANNFRMLYPEEARIVDVESNGRKFKKYPNYGRVTERVIYNVAFAQNLKAGAHVLDLPLRNGAEMLGAWLEGKDLMGNTRHPINDPERCVPVFVKLKENSTNPWMIQVESNQPVQLPVQLADTDYIYNLDDILVTKSKEEILSKLRDMYPGDVFDDCMNGFPGLTRKPTQGHSTFAATSKPASAPVQPEPQIPKATLDYGAAIPKASISPVEALRADVVMPRANPVEVMRADVAVPFAPVNPPPATDLDSLPPNPMMAGRLSREEALRFMSQE